MTFLQLLIINKSGGLIYNQNLSPTAPTLQSNDWLRLGSTFHSLHAIAAQIAPVLSAGIEKLETDTFKLQCFQTLTGMKFVLTAVAGTPALDVALKQIYEIFSDYVLKNPFYELDMPIRCELFTRHLTALVETYHHVGGNNK
ncbi:Sybindin-like protein [Pelagophyceae sp. CCMP2097]|nr:Sybindin-like protein [Pelagophyceae sp. CCMP2097]|mmetsp:Transcript_21436/g.72649  ORF Transcript_21436/g.72649 Transcript_21436/m.72649 type:complete len:142 (-) Transcript_21436:412-837(-)